VKEWRCQVWINGKKTRRRLAIDPLSHAQHLAGKFKLVFFTAHMLYGGIGKSQVEGLIWKRYIAGRRLNISEATSIVWRKNVQNRYAGRAPKNLPRITPSSNIQDCLARCVIGTEILESFLLKIFPDRFLEINWVHKGIGIVKEFPPFTLRREPLG